MAERQGFEPWIRGYRILDFESSAFDHSATFPFGPLCRVARSKANDYSRVGNKSDTALDHMLIYSICGWGY